MTKITRLAKSIGKRLFLLTLALFVSLFLIELILRLVGYSPAVTSPLTAFHQANPRLGWSGIPNHSSRFKTLNFDALVSTDNEGFRNVTSDVSPARGAPEVWVLGDSTTWGWGVSNGELFADVIQSEVGPSLRIKNFSMNAYSTLQEYLLLEDLLQQKKAPVKLLVMVCSNDFSDNLADQGGVRPFLKEIDTEGRFVIANLPVERQIGGTLATVGRHSYAFSFLMYCSSLFKQIRKRGQLDDLFTPAWEQAAIRPRGESPAHITGPQFEAIQFALRRIDDLCKSSRIDLDIISFPQGTSPYIKTAESIALEKICEDLDANFIDIESAMIEERRKYYIGKGDFHWSAAGNRKGAEVLIQRLGKNLGL